MDHRAQVGESGDAACVRPGDIDRSKTIAYETIQVLQAHDATGEIVRNRRTGGIAVGDFAGAGSIPNQSASHVVCAVDYGVRKTSADICVGHEANQATGTCAHACVIDMTRDN